MDIQNLNKVAWDQAVDDGDNPYTKVILSQQIAAAKAGDWRFI